MNSPSNLNLLVGWVWMWLAFLSGLVAGLFFHDEHWLGGYAALRRRMIRLGHISFFGLGAVNLLFWLTARALSWSGPMAECASWSFIIGAVTMPACCLAMAHSPKARFLFAAPVLSLVAAGALTLILLAASQRAPSASSTENRAAESSTINSHWKL